MVIIIIIIIIIVIIVIIIIITIISCFSGSIVQNRYHNFRLKRGFTQHL